MKRFAFAVACAVLGVSSLAWADGTAPQRPQRSGHYDAPEVEITGRRQYPAAVEVAKLQPSVTLIELKQAFVGRVADAVARDPF